VAQSRYREARTLVRRLCRLPGEDRAQFNGKLARLREHFERFNVDTSELCQWLMGLRKTYDHPDQPAGFGALGDFLLEPSLDGIEADEAESDRWRLAAFDEIAGFRPAGGSASFPLPDTLRELMRAEAKRPKSPTTTKLFGRLRALEPAHRLVLLKSAAEWVVARYRRTMENWVRQHAEWEKEKSEWEGRHPELTEAVRTRFTDVFRKLVWDKGKPPGVKSKRPRICLYERMRGNLDNCAYAGQKGHGPLCWRFDEFVKDRKQRHTNFNDKKFADDAGNYLSLRPQSRSRQDARRRLFPSDQRAQQRFLENWTAYLQFTRKPVPGITPGFDALNEQTALDQGRLPHCLKIGETFEKSKCEWNPHTELCKQYKRALDQFDADTAKLEPLYREWRRDYLAGPRKPQFRYPSSRDLPMPKIFGDGFHKIDFDRSILRLRLDDMPAGQWLEFGFTPWPRGYRPSRDEVKELVTSVHVHFIGTRARVGFRFDVPHKQSRFACTQDELDELRSRRFPRQAQDQQFLDAARQRMLESFSGNADTDLRILAVDLGEKGACAAVYQGRRHEADVPLAIVKINKLYDSPPESLDPDKRGRPAAERRKFDKDDPRGLRKEHVGRHLARLAEGVKEVAAHRQSPVATPVTAGEHDFRGLKRHLAWMIRDWARHNASQVVAAAEQHCCDLVVFESLRGFKPPGYNELVAKSGKPTLEKKRWLAMFAFGRVRRKVTEKAVERGLRVVTVPYFKSSQVCSACGRVQQNSGLLRKNKNARKFECEHCRAMLNSDANAARVLARVFWDEITLPSPDVASGSSRGA